MNFSFQDKDQPHNNQELREAELEGFNKAIEALAKANHEFFNGQKHCSKFFAFWLEAKKEDLLR